MIRRLCQNTYWHVWTVSLYYKIVPSINRDSSSQGIKALFSLKQHTRFVEISQLTPRLDRTNAKVFGALGKFQAVRTLTCTHVHAKYAISKQLNMKTSYQNIKMSSKYKCIFNETVILKHIHKLAYITYSICKIWQLAVRTLLLLLSEQCYFRPQNVVVSYSSCTNFAAHYIYNNLPP